MNKILTGKSGNVILELRQETASAWLTIKKSGKLIDEREILELIEEAGLMSGFDEAMDYIREKGIEKEFDKPFPIAICKKSDDQKEAIITYNFDTEAIKDVQNISLVELSKISYVEKGDVLAQYSDNIFQSNGSLYDIFGELITPPKVDEEKAKTLASAEVRYEAREYIANITGYPYLDAKGRLRILSSLNVSAGSIPKDITLRSPLKLFIEGDLNGVNLICAQHLLVAGDLRDCSLFCEGDLTVEGEIYSSTSPGIQVLGEMKVNAIHNSRVYVRKKITFDDIIEHSFIATDGELIGTKEESRILGGLAQAAGNITIGVAGSTGGEETEIEIAISPFYRALLMQMTKESVKMREAGNEEALDDLHKRIKRCESELDNQLNAFLKRDTEELKTITVLSAVYPKVLFRVLKHSYQIKTRQQGIQLLEKE